MATKPSSGSIFDRLRVEIVEYFHSIQREFDRKKETLLSKVAQLEQRHEALNKEVETAKAQLEKLKDSTVEILTSNILENAPSNIIQSMDEKIAALRLKMVLPDYSLKLYYNAGLMKKALSAIDVVSLSSDVTTDSLLIRKLPVVKVGRQGTGEGRISEPCSVCFYAGNSRVYVADQCGRIVVLTDQGEFVEEFTHTKMQQPWGLYVYNDFIYTTDYSHHLLFKFSMTGECIVTRGGKGKGDGKFISPLGVAVEDELVYVCDELNHRIQIFNSDLAFHDKFYIDVNPQDVKIHNNLIYILALYEPNIFVYSKKGISMNSIISPSSIEKLYFFAIDGSGNFIFTGEEKNIISICSPQGELITTLGKGVCYKPQGVAVDSLGRIICVCDAKKDMLHIY